MEVRLQQERLTDKIIGAAIEVHRRLGPGLLENAYEECLCHELGLRKIPFERQKPLPLQYKGLNLKCSYRLDIVVDDTVILEIKCVEKLAPIHEAQLLTYLRLSGRRIGFLLNFHEARLVDGFKRIVL